MRINNNLAAINTNRVASIVNNEKSKAIQKLSSGFRINSAADDAAGLTISVKMRAQIRGLNQASRNVQDGISLLQTAESALEEVHRLLERGRELSVQAVNGTNTDEDRTTMQAEFNEIVKEVDNISDNTEFNTIKLLNVKGSSSVATGTSASLIETIKTGLKSGWLETGADMITTYYGLTESTRSIEVVFDEGAVGGNLASVQTTWSVLGDTATVSKMELHIDLADFNPSTGVDGENSMTTAGGTMYNDRIITHEMVHAVMADQMGDDFFDMPTWFKEGSAEFIHGADDRVEGDGLAASVARAGDLIDGTVTWSGSSLNYSGAYIALKFIEDNLSGGSTMADIFNDIQDGDDANDATMDAIIANTTFTSVGNFKTLLLAGGAGIMNIDAGAGETDTGSIGGSDHGGAAKDASAVVATGTLAENPTNFNFDLSSTSIATTSNSSITLQIGANSTEKLGFDLVSVGASDLGIKSLDLVKSAGKAITSLDSAIKVISKARSGFGAVQNRLEHIVKMTNNYSENLQASESRIRDVDMAGEMMKFTKNNILSQAANAMLAQANQMPKGVLQLVG